MSYVQFLVELDRNNSFPMGRCAQDLWESREGDIIWTTPSMMPDHRADEMMARDRIFDHSPDTFQPAPEGLTPLEQIMFQDLKKKGGRVMGRHDAVVDLPFYLNLTFVQRRLQCSPQEASTLLDALKALEADKNAVNEALEYVKANGLEAATEYYRMLADEMAKLECDPEDAMEHRNTEGFAHVEQDYSSSNESPEMAVLLSEGVPSAAQMAHDLGVSLEQASRVRFSIIVQDYESAVHQVEAAQSQVDDDDDEIDVEPEEDDRDFSGFVAEGWHLMDEVDDAQPSWLDKQPADVYEMYHAAKRAKSLDELKKLGQDVYALTHWTNIQRTAFWSYWNARKGAILLDNEARFVKVRKGAQRIMNAEPRELSSIGKKLYDLQKSNPDFYTNEGWTRLWDLHKARKAQVGMKSVVDRGALVANFLKVRAAKEAIMNQEELGSRLSEFSADLICRDDYCESLHDQLTRYDVVEQEAPAYNDNY